MLEVGDLDGLICGFVLAPVERCDAGAFDEETDRPVWLHFNLSDARAQRWIAGRDDLPERAREVLLDHDPRVHVDLLEDGLVGVLADLHHDFRGDPEDFGVLRVYVDGRRMISGRGHPLKSSDRLRLEARGGALDATTTLELFVESIHFIAETFADVVAELGDQTDDAEEEILAGRVQEKGKALGRQRRLMARLRRSLAANRAALAPLATRLPAAFGSDGQKQLRHALERIDAASQDLDLVQERARLLQEEIAARVGEATNRNLFLLSIVTTALLPITLVTGIFGMNVGGLPWVNHESGFLWVVLVMVVTAILTLLVLRWRRVL